MEAAVQRRVQARSVTATSGTMLWERVKVTGFVVVGILHLFRIFAVTLAFVGDGGGEGSWRMGGGPVYRLVEGSRQEIRVRFPVLYGSSPAAFVAWLEVAIENGSMFVAPAKHGSFVTSGRGQGLVGCQVIHIACISRFWEQKNRWKRTLYPLYLFVFVNRWKKKAQCACAWRRFSISKNTALVFQGFVLALLGLEKGENNIELRYFSCLFPPKNGRLSEWSSKTTEEKKT